MEDAHRHPTGRVSMTRMLGGKKKKKNVSWCTQNGLEHRVVLAQMLGALEMGEARADPGGDDGRGGRGVAHKLVRDGGRLGRGVLVLGPDVDVDDLVRLDLGCVNNRRTSS